ncbi:hypothetical protein K2224_15360 [Streptomyces sp. BHT-5-2]|uniref:hypothetical protein n=1 Tax=Streptomyces sp. BHT-5-2 TaxID=2866715 RepID=UPI001C8EB2FF|nr:hypothetical protein [Streptomyces sp. BHT-5-2]QZL04380.1 hypothetical protein K2224_15360 [Streptomyces sp. BHT-5-2]
MPALDAVGDHADAAGSAVGIGAPPFQLTAGHSSGSIRWILFCRADASLPPSFIGLFTLTRKHSRRHGCRRCSVSECASWPNTVMARWRSVAPANDERPVWYSVAAEVTAAESQLQQLICVAMAVHLSYADEILMTCGQVKTA